MKPRRAPWLGMLVALLLLPMVWVVEVQADELDDIYALADRKAYAEAMERLDKVLASSPKDARARFLKGLILTEQKKRDQAIGIFQELIKDFPDLPEPYNNLAVLHAEGGDYDSAAEALRKAIKTHPSYATAHENLGDIYAKMASLAYGKALQLNKENALAEAKLAMVKKLFGAPRSQPEPQAVVSAAPELTNPVAEAPDAKGKPSKAEVAKAKAKAEAEAAKAEAEATKAEAKAKAEAAKAEAKAKAEAAKVEAAEAKAKAEAAKAEAKAEAKAKAEAAKAEAAEAKAKAEAAKAEAKAEAAKAEAAKVEVAKAEVAPPDPKSVPKAAALGADDLNKVHAEVVEVAQGWAKAWSSQDVRRYLAYYAPEFRPPNGQSRRAWERAREQKIGAPRFISVRLGNLNVHLTKEREVRVGFVQHYRSDNFTDQVQKVLLLRKVDGHWKIVQEQVDG